MAPGDPQQRLQQTRQELRELLEAAASGQSDIFPRSATMRMLVGSAGRGVAGAALSALVVGTAPRALSLLRFIPLKAMALALFRGRRKRSRDARPEV